MPVFYIELPPLAPDFSGFDHESISVAWQYSWITQPR
jgi:hypothetical protein